MSRHADPHHEAKRRAAAASLAYVKDGMRLGLGTGSTAELVVELLAAEVARGLRVEAVPTSRRTAHLATEAGIPLVDFTCTLELDLAIDGADEFDPALNLIKGHGGALLYEKIVACAARQLVIVVDATKRVERLGLRALPIEVVPFAQPRITAALEALGARVAPRLEGPDRPYRTEAGHHILDARFEAIDDPRGLAARLDGMPGVVEHGLFLGLADRVLVADGDTVHTLVREGAQEP